MSQYNMYHGDANGWLPKVNLNACRACLNTKTTSFISLYTEDWLQKFQYCLNLKIKAQHEEVGSNFLCDACADAVTKFVKFKQKCIKSDDFWKSLKSEIRITVNDINDHVNIELDNQKTRIKNEDVEENYISDDNSFDNNTLEKGIKIEYEQQDNIIWVERSSDIIENVKEFQTIKKNKKRKKIALKSKGKPLFLSVDGKRKLRHFGGRCHKCLREFSYKGALMTHLENCRAQKKLISGKLKKKQDKMLPKNPSDVFYCGICDITLPTEEGMTSHLNEHQASSSLNCSQCSFTADDFAQLLAHRYNHHPKEYRLDVHCHKCKKRFWMPQGLEFHYRGEYLKKKPGLCHICKRQFRNYKTCKRHIKRHDEWKFECDHCGRRYLFRAEFIAHLNDHSDVKNFICDLCGFCTKRRSNLKSHKEARHRTYTPVICERCAKVFKNEKTLADHVRMYHNEVNERHACPVCRKTYTSNYLLSRHMICHSSVKQFVCHLCNRAYKFKQHLNDHMRKHTGEQPYKCSVCGKGFFTSSLLKRHGRLHAPKPSQVKLLGKDEKNAREYVLC